MSQIAWIIIFAAVLVVAYLFMRRAGQGEKEARQVGIGQSIAWGVIALGGLLLLMPWASGTISSLETINGDAFAILTGSTYVLGFFVVIAGIALLLARESTQA